MTKELPGGWKWVNLHEAVEVLDNLRKPVNSSERLKRISGKSTEELFPYYGATGQVGWIDSYLTDGEYILIGEDGAPFLDMFKSKAYRITGKTWVNNHAHILKHRDGKTLNSFILYYLNSIDYKSYVNGTTRLKLTKGSLITIPFPLPTISIQKAIVCKIEELFSELDKGIENLKIAQEQLKVYRQSVLKWAFEGKLTKEWRNRQIDLSNAETLIKHIKDLKDDEAKSIGKKLKPTNSLSIDEVNCLSALPKSWCWVSLGEVISDLTDYHANGSYIKIKENVQLLNLPNYAIMIRATNFEKENFETDLKYITEHAYNFLSRSRLFGGEILIGKIGNAGKIYFMPFLNRPASLAMNLFALRFNVDINKYIYYHLLSTFSKQEVSNYVKGVGNPTIDKNSVRSLSIALPSLQEQQEIVQEIESRLSVSDKMEETIQQSLLQAESLRQSILKKAFEGTLI